MNVHAMDCGLCCGLSECDCGADAPPDDPPIVEDIPEPEPPTEAAFSFQNP